MTLKISTGLAVYNGERYVSQAIESLLGQTFGDFELIISDNASTDGTQEICRKYAKEDKRIVFFKQRSNKGAAWNFNFVAKHARGEYFKWMAHDDICDHRFFEKSVAVLDSFESNVLCYSRCLEIDEEGLPIKEKDYNLRDWSSDPLQRFSDIITINHNCNSVFGLIRTEALAKTPLIARYVGSDRVLLARLALVGRFHMIPEVLLYHREHNQRSTRAIPKLQKRIGWFDPRKANYLTFPHWRLWVEYLKALSNSKLDITNKTQCLQYLIKWLPYNIPNLWDDLKYAANYLFSYCVKNDTSPETI